MELKTTLCSSQQKCDSDTLRTSFCTRFARRINDAATQRCVLTEEKRNENSETSIQAVNIFNSKYQTNLIMDVTRQCKGNCSSLIAGHEIGEYELP